LIVTLLPLTVAGREELTAIESPFNSTLTIIELSPNVFLNVATVVKPARHLADQWQTADILQRMPAWKCTRLPLQLDPCPYPSFTIASSNNLLPESRQNEKTGNNEL